MTVRDLADQPILSPPHPLTINATKQLITSMYIDHGVQPGKEIPVTNYDEVPALLEENGVVFISPMANPSAYRDAADYSILEKQPAHSRVFKHESSRRYGFIVLLLK